jgi:hypothetical protein
MMEMKALRPRLPLLAVAVTALVLTERLFLLVHRYAVNIFFSDQWEFNAATVFQSHTLWEIFTWQHGPHRQGLGGVLAKLIEPHFQWDSRIESFFIAGILVVTGLLSIWLKQRLFGRLEYYDVVIPTLVLTATQCEVLFGAANLAHGSLPLLLVVVYCVCWTVQNPIYRFAALLLVNFVLIFTGFGLLMGAITPVAIVFSLWGAHATKREVLIHLSALAAALLSLGIFFVHYAWNPAVDCYDSVLVSRSAANYFHFASLMFANYLGFDGLSSKHPEIWGGLFLLLLLGIFGATVASISRSRKLLARPNTVQLVAFVLLAFSLLFCAATARGRLCLGFGAAQESRYMPYLTPAFLGAYFYLGFALPQSWMRHAVLSACLVICAYAGWPVHLGDQLEITGFHAVKLQWKTCYLASKDIATCNRQIGRRICNAPEAPNLKEKLNFLEKEHLNLFNGR